MLNEFKNFFEVNKISKNARFLVGVSGGLDSMVILDLALKCGLNCAVAHVNYQLRKEESDNDAERVRKFCEKQKIPFHLDESGLKDCKNIQIAAREIRYNFFYKLLNDYQYDYIITAHHKNDDHETFLLNALRGSGIRGLKGIPTHRKKIIRPALQFTKTQLHEYALNNSIPFGDDSSNLISKYDRNFIRNKVLPIVTKRFENAEHGLSTSIDNLKRDYSLLNELVNKAIHPLITKKGENLILKPSTEITKDCWFYYLNQFGFNYNQISSWIDKNSQSGKYISSDKYKLIKDRETWILSPIELNEGDFSFIKLYEDKNVSQPLNLNCKTFTMTGALIKDENIGLFNKKLLKFPLVLRKWEHGDKIQPLGMKGLKKVSDILIDKKISLEEKKNIYVVLSQDEIVWIVGHVVNEKYKVILGEDLVYKMILIT